MQVIGKVINTTVANRGQKQVCLVAIQTGESLIQCAIWLSDKTRHMQERAEKALGQEIITEINPEIYNNNLQYSFGFDATFMPVKNIYNKSAEPLKKVG